MQEVTGLDVKFSPNNPCKILSSTAIADLWDEAQSFPEHVLLPVAFAHLIEERLLEIIDSSENVQKAIKLAVDSSSIKLKEKREVIN